MTEDEKREHAELIHKFGCSDITAEQRRRLEELDDMALQEAGKQQSS